MKRRLGALTALLCLCAAGAAYAVQPVIGGPNTYTGNFAVSGALGTAKKPGALAITETLGMGSTTQGNVGAPLTNISTRLYGMSAPNAKYFPTCSVATITANGNSGKWNAVCPKNSLVAQGTVTAALTSPTLALKGPGAPCHLKLWVYNGGPGKLTYFFTTTPAQCDSNSTGAAAPWLGTVTQAGKYLDTNTPEPADVSYNAAGIGLFGSLESETLNFKKLSITKDKKVYPFFESIGCLHGTRPWTITYTATDSNSGKPTYAPATVKGTAKCG